MLAGERATRTPARCRRSAPATPHGEITLEEAAEAGLPRVRVARRRLPVPRHRGHVAGRRRGARPDAAALGARPVGPADLARHGPALGAALVEHARTAGITTQHILTDAAFSNAHGGATRRSAAARTCCCTRRRSRSTPGVRRPTVDDWTDVNRQRAAARRCAAERPDRPPDDPRVPRRRRAGGDAAPARTRPARTRRPHRHRRDARRRSSTGGRSPSAASGCASCCATRDGVDPGRRHHVAGRRRKARGLTSTVTFPRGNLAPGGCGHQIDGDRPAVVDADGVYRKTGPAKVFTTREGGDRGDQGRGRPQGRSRATCWCCAAAGRWASGMEETYQLTSALKHLTWGKQVAVVTDARFSGVSTGACIGHVSPEALAGGPIGKLRDGDRIQIVIDRNKLEGSVDLVGDATGDHGADVGHGGTGRAAAAPGPARPTRRCRPTRGSGPRCSTPAAASGAAACTTRTRSRRSWLGGER